MTQDATVSGNFQVDLLDGADNTTVASCSAWEFVSSWTCSFQDSPTAAGLYYLRLVPTAADVPETDASQLEGMLQV